MAKAVTEKEKSMSKIEDRRQVLINHARANGDKITTKEANDLLAGCYYCNHEHYVSEILFRLVKSGLFTRLKKGHYEINQNYRPKPAKGKSNGTGPELFTKAATL